MRVLGNVNTLSEAATLAYTCRTLEGDLEIVAPPFHIVRAFMTLVTALRSAHVRHRVYARTGTPLGWNDAATHSQGTLRARRSDLPGSELQRLEQ